MPYDSNGNFSLVPGTIVADGMNIQPSQHNPPFQDVAAGLSMAVVRDGRAPMAGPLNMNGNKISNVGSGDHPGDVVTRADISNMAVAIGDGAWSVRDLGSDWLRRDGKLYLRADYPELAPLMPALPDGMIWENRASGTSNSPRAITQSPTRLTAITRGTSGFSEITASVEGGEWSVRTTFPDFYAQSISYGGGIYVALGANGHYSQSVDGDVWSTPVLIPGASAGITSLDFGDGAFVAAGAIDGDRAIWRSTNGTTWTRVGPTSVSGLINEVRYLGGRFVAVGLSGAIYYSDDGGETWNAASLGSSQNLNGVAFDGTTYVVVGSGGYIATSQTLSGWTQRTSGTALQLTSVAGGSTGFVAIGNAGIVLLSSTGVSWSSAISGTTDDLRQIIVDQDNPARNFIVGPPSIIIYGVRTLPTQFRVPNDDPTYGWIRAL